MKKETTLPTPKTAYGMSKLAAEKIHKIWQAEKPNQRKLIILRPGVVFGQYEGGNFTRLHKSIKKHMFAYPGRKDTKKAGIYVKDLVRIMLEMVEDKPPGVHLYNMCYPEPHTIEQIVETMSEVIDKRPPKLKIPAFLLKSTAALLKGFSSITGMNFMGIHPDRIKKLMISTNISGEKLQKDGYEMEYTLKEALKDWLLTTEDTENH